MGWLVLTVPRAWARYHNLKPGDRVVAIANGDLLVRPKPDNRREEPGGSK